MNEIGTLAKEIADFRKGNGLERATIHEVIADIETATCTRLHDDPNWCIAQKKRMVRAAIAHLSKNVGLAAAGGRILVDWLGDKCKPVPIRQAQARANVCLECEHNKEGHSFLKLTADTVRAIAEQMNAKEHLKLRVDGEEKLQACEICGCVTTLKVHVPLKTILEHTDEETLNAFPPWCFIQTERQTIP